MPLARTGFGCARADHDKPVETRMAESVYSQIIGYGWDEATARAYVKDTMSRRGPRTTVDELYKKYQLAGKHVLEVGSGLGNVLIEFGLRKVRAVGIEPGEEWSQIVDERLRLHGCDSCTILRAYGESLPFNDESFDFVISMQVLEHVTDPVRTIEEMYRVLRPGGICVTIAPNYFSFFETHYRVLWFPGMPRRLGAWYLKLRG